MATPKQELLAAIARVKAPRAEGIAALKLLAAMGYDLGSPNFLDRVSRDTVTVNRQADAIEAEVAQLVALAKSYGVTVDPSGIAPPVHRGSKAKLGTVADLPDLSKVDNPDEKESDLIAQLTEQFFNPTGPGTTGLKIGTGQAASDDSNYDTMVKGKSDQDIQKLTNDLKITAAGFEATARLIEALCDAIQRMNNAMAHYNRAVERLNKLKVPNPDSTDGEFKFKHPIHDPWSDRLQHPKGLKPLHDPTRGDFTSEASNILKTRNPAIDPVPGDGKDEVGAKKTIRTTSDAVIDPSPAASTTKQRGSKRKRRR